MASSSNVSWDLELRDSVRTNFGQGWLVNGEKSGKTKYYMFITKGLVREIQTTYK